MSRKVMDCRRFPSESNCSLTLIGEESEVLTEACEHAIRTHGHTDTPELRDMIKLALEEESEFDRRTGKTSEYSREPLYTG